MFNACDDLEDPNNLAVFFESINDGFAGYVQYNSSEPISVQTFCNRIKTDVIKYYPAFLQTCCN